MGGTANFRSKTVVMRQRVDGLCVVVVRPAVRIIAATVVGILGLVIRIIILFGTCMSAGITLALALVNHASRRLGVGCVIGLAGRSTRRRTHIVLDIAALAVDGPLLMLRLARVVLLALVLSLLSRLSLVHLSRAFIRLADRRIVLHALDCRTWRCRRRRAWHRPSVATKACVERKRAVTLRAIHALLAPLIAVRIAHWAHHARGTSWRCREGVCTVKRRPSHGRMRGQGRGTWKHGVVVMLLEGWQPGGPAKLAVAVFPALFSSSHDLAGPALVGGVVEEGTDVVYEQRIKKFGNLLLVGKIQSSLKGDPDTLEVHRANLHNMTDLLALENTVTASAGHASDVEELSAVDHGIVFPASNTDASCFNLEAQTAFILPQRGSDTGLHTGGCDLASCVETAAGVNSRIHAAATRKWQDRLAGHRVHGRGERRRNRSRRAKSVGISVLGVTILVSIG